MPVPAPHPDGIPGSRLSGPWPVGEYAAALRDRLRGFTRVQVFGEVFGLKVGRAKVWFELRDRWGALPCSMWRKDWDLLGLDTLADGAVVVAAGGCDFYAGSRTSSPSFSFAVSKLRVAGEGDLLAQVERLRRALADEGLFEPQKRLPRPSLPRTIGVVSGEGGKARDDVLAGLRRRGWAGRIVWAFAPVQDRHAAPAITRALQDLAACEEVEVIVVARGGGSLADLFAFCDETLCRTVALLRVPVISSVGHHTDRTLIDDVAAIACSTPTHAAEAAVPVDCAAARAQLHGARRAARAALAAGDRRARPRAGAALARARRPRRAPPHPPAPARARAARDRPPPARDRRRATRRPPRSCSSARRAPRRAPSRSSTRATSSASRSRSPPTSRSARSSAATRSSRTPPASPSPPRPPPASTPS